MHGRRRPYTATGIRRLPCARCGARPSEFQWQICSDSRLYRPLCASCDVDLNRMVLEWVGFPDREEKLRRYVAAAR